MKILETERLVLRQLTPADAPFILELLNDPLFHRFVGDKGIRTVEGARDYIISGPIASYAQHGFGLFHVAHKQTGVPIGMCGLLKRPVLEDVDVGFAYLPQFSGQGYATEAALAIMQYGYTVIGLKRIVEKLGHQVVTAEDGSAGVEAAKREIPDLILMDVVMPNLNGFQATRTISKDAKTSHIPIVLVTTKDQETDRVWGIRQGAKAYVTKPVNEGELVDTINKLLPAA